MAFFLPVYQSQPSGHRVHKKLSGFVKTTGYSVLRFEYPLSNRFPLVKEGTIAVGYRLNYGRLGPKVMSIGLQMVQIYTCHITGDCIQAI